MNPVMLYVDVGVTFHGFDFNSIISMSCWPGSGWLGPMQWTLSVWQSRITSTILPRSRSLSIRYMVKSINWYHQIKGLANWLIWRNPYREKFGMYILCMWLSVLCDMFRRWPARPIAGWWWSISRLWCRNGSPSRTQMRGGRERTGWLRRLSSSSSSSGNSLLWVFIYCYRSVLFSKEMLSRNYMHLDLVFQQIVSHDSLFIFDVRKTALLW